MSNPPASVERALDVCLSAAFWLPLVVCTYLAVTPSPPDALFRVSDVVLHALAFSYLTLALGLAHRQRLPAVAAWMLGYGVLIEVLQSFTAERSPEIKDLLVDTGGIVLGLGLLHSAGHTLRRWGGSILARLVGRGEVGGEP